MKVFNPYKIKWAILTPIKGIARKEDVILLNKISLFKGHRNITVHAPSQEALESKLDAVRGKLKKAYYVVIITDKQFGMSKNGIFPVTRKQIEKQFILK